MKTFRLKSLSRFSIFYNNKFNYIEITHGLFGVHAYRHKLSWEKGFKYEFIVLPF